MKRSFGLFASVVFALILCAGAARAQGPDKSEGRGAVVPFDSDRWVFAGEGAKREEHMGRPSLFLGGGTFAHLKDVDFIDGTIEVDVAASRPRGFLGVVFRFESRDAHEIFYLRTHKSGLDDATQYTPAFNGAHPWQLYSNKGFTAAAEIPRDRWLRVRIEVEGLRARVFLGDSPAPVLIVEDLKRGHGRGSVGLWGSAMGGHFSEFRFTPARPADRPAPRRVPPTPAGTLTKWELSEAFETAGKDLEVLPAADAWKALRWERVTAEAPGLLVIDRYRRSPNVIPPYATDFEQRLQKPRGPAAVYARATIRSEREQVKRLKLGYSDEVTVFLNGRPIYTGKSAYRFRDPGFLGIMDVEDDALHLPLRKGDNELVLAVSEYFGGWGFVCRLDDTGGVTID